MSWYDTLLQRRRRLNELIEYARRVSLNSPEGTLQVSTSHGCDQYYRYLPMTGKNSSPRKEYIGKDDFQMAYRLAEKEYAAKLCDRAWRELTFLNQYLVEYDKYAVEDTYDSMPPGKKKLVTDHLSDAAFAKKWYERSFSPNMYKPEEKTYETSFGVWVRSKSELIIAEIYHELGIPFHYEEQLNLSNRHRRYPDFTALKVRSREVIYHEHLGLLDQEDYLRQNLKKLDEYSKHGIYLGVNLIITYETVDHPFDRSGIENMIRKVFL